MKSFDEVPDGTSVPANGGGPVGMPDVDWNEVWRQQHARRRREYPRDPDHWNKRADDFTRAANHGDYIHQFIGFLNPRPQWTVLDVGSAAGTLAVPLAAQVKSVTALDPSARMRELLAERCREQGIANIHVVDGAWEDDWDAIGLEPHSVALASRALVTGDLVAAIRKLEKFATRRVIVSHMVDDGPHDRRIIEAAGRAFVPGADYIVLYNVLRQMGIHANVGFTHSRERRVYADLEDAVAQLKWMLPRLTEAEEARLRDYLRDNLVPVDGGVRLPYVKHTRWAVIWWDLPREEDVDD